MSTPQSESFDERMSRYERMEKEHAEFKRALERIVAKSHSWLITRETGAMEQPIHAYYRDIATQALGGV